MEAIHVYVAYAVVGVIGLFLVVGSIVNWRLFGPIYGLLALAVVFSWALSVVFK